jgi:hypothetical protein
VAGEDGLPGQVQERGGGEGGVLDEDLTRCNGRGSERGVGLGKSKITCLTRHWARRFVYGVGRRGDIFATFLLFSIILSGIWTSLYRVYWVEFLCWKNTTMMNKHNTIHFFRPILRM